MGLQSPRQTCTGCLIVFTQVSVVTTAPPVKWRHPSPLSRHVRLPYILPTRYVLYALVCALRAECRLLMSCHRGLTMLACGSATFLIFTVRTGGSDEFSTVDTVFALGGANHVANDARSSRSRWQP
jgi:hypothetical protein